MIRKHGAAGQVCLRRRKFRVSCNVFGRGAIDHLAIPEDAQIAADSGSVLPMQYLWERPIAKQEIGADSRLRRRKALALAQSYRY